MALVSHYTDGSKESVDAKDVHYYSFTNDTEVNDDFQPWIDVCYKKVEIKECNDDYGKVCRESVICSATFRSLLIYCFIFTTS